MSNPPTPELSSTSPSPPRPTAPALLPPTNLTPLTAPELAGLHHWSLYGQSHDPLLQATKPRTLSPRHPKKMSTPVFSHWHVPVSAEQMAKFRRGFAPGAMEDKWLVYCVGGEGDEEVEEESEEEEEDGDEEASSSEFELSASGSESEDAKVKPKATSGPPISPSPSPCSSSNPPFYTPNQYQNQSQETLQIHMVRSWTGRPIYEIQILVLRDQGSKKGEAEMEGRIQSLVWESDKKVVGGHNERAAKERAREVCRWVLGMELLPDVPRSRRVDGDGM